MLNLSILLQVAHSNEIQWTYSELEQACKASVEQNQYQSPINIQSPFVYQDPSIVFQYSKNYGAVSLVNNQGNNLKMLGDFGQIIMDGTQVFTAQEITFHSPAEHTFSKSQKRYPLEMQIMHIDQDNNKAIVSVFFDTGNEDSEFLALIGFDPENNPKLSNMLKSITSNEELVVQDTIFDLKNLVGEPDEYLMYEGTTTEPPCQSDVTWILLSQKRTISQKQLEVFPKQLAGQYRATKQQASREIRLSFRDQSSSKDNYSENVPSQDNEESVFWSNAIEVPSQSQLNGIIINHPDGVSFERKKLQAENDEITRLTHRALKLSNSKSKVNKNKNIVYQIDQEQKDDEQSLIEVKQPEAQQYQQNATQESYNSEESEADSLFNEFMADFFSSKTPQKGLNSVQKQLNKQNRPYNSFIQVSQNVVLSEDGYQLQDNSQSEFNQDDDINNDFDKLFLEDSKDDMNQDQQDIDDQDWSENLENVQTNELYVDNDIDDNEDDKFISSESQLAEQYDDNNNINNENDKEDSGLIPFELEIPQYPRKEAFSKIVHSVNIDDLQIAKMPKDSQIQFDGVQSKVDLKTRERDTIKLMDSGPTIPIASYLANTLKKQFKDCNTNETVNQSIRITDQQQIMSQQQYKDPAQDKSLLKLNKMTSAQTLLNQQQTSKFIQGDQLEGKIKQQTDNRDQAQKAYLQSFDNAFQTDKFIDEHQSREKVYPNQDLVSHVLKKSKKYIASKQEYIENVTDQIISQVSNHSKTISPTLSVEKYLKTKNDDLIKQEEQFLGKIHNQPKRDSKQRMFKPLVNQMDDLIVEYQQKSDVVAKNRSLDDFQKNQVNMLISKFETDKAIQNSDIESLVNEGENNPSYGIKINRDYETLFDKGNNKDITLAKSTNNSISKGLEDRVKLELKRDKWLEGKWDDSSLIDEEDDLVQNILNHKKTELKLETTKNAQQRYQNYEERLKSHKTQNDQNQYLNQLDAIRFVETKQKLLGSNLCNSGKYQSPINLNAPFQQEPTNIAIDYLYNDISQRIPILKRNLQSGMIFIEGQWGSLEFDSETYQMYGLYIFHPSEHSFGQESLKSDMEIQLVHYSSSSSKILILSLLYDLNSQTHLENQFLKNLNIKENFCDQNKQEHQYSSADLRLEDLVNGNLEEKIRQSYYVRYEGSLSYAPCTENVTHIVILNKFSNINEQQLMDLANLSGTNSNSRPTQPLNSRKLYMS